MTKPNKEKAKATKPPGGPRGKKKAAEEPENEENAVNLKMLPIGDIKSIRKTSFLLIFS
jgi:hypothetical protein